VSPCFCQEAFGRASKINPRVNHHARVAAFPDLSGRDRCVVAANACKRVGTVNQSVIDRGFFCIRSALAPHELAKAR
jgi:hypothetical protein